MEMKANVASAIKEMMAQMNSGNDSILTKKNDVDVKNENKIVGDDLLKNDDKGNEIKKNIVKENSGSCTDFQLEHKVDSSFEKQSSVPQKREVSEAKKTFVTTIPTPYGSSAVKPLAADVKNTTDKNSEPVKPIISKVSAVDEKKDSTIATHEKTVISNGTVIKGNIISKANLELSGEVLGNVKVDGEFKIWGRVEGDIDAQSLKVIGGKIKGNIFSLGNVNLDADSVIAGNINAESLLLDGKLKGDADIEGAVTIGSSGVQIGKISAKQLAIGQGAKLNSTIQMTNEDASAIAEEVFS